MRILLVDDNHELRHATLELLEAQGHEVVPAACADEALEQARGTAFDLLVTDLSMPGMDGLELAESFRAIPREDPRPPAILMTSTDRDYPGLARWLAGDRAYFLRKPFSPTELARAVERAPSSERAPGPTRSPAATHGAFRRTPRSMRPASRPARAPSAALRDGGRVPLWGLAAAAFLAVAAAGTLWMLEQEIPGLPTPPPQTAFRGLEIQLDEPVGPIAELPPAFQWQAIDGIYHYRLTVQAVDGTRLWQGSTNHPRLELPPELAAELHPAVAYTWSVEALDAAGTRIAWSRQTRFRVLSPELGTAVGSFPGHGA